MVANDHKDIRDICLLEDGNRLFDHCLAANRKQGLELPHPFGQTCSHDQANGFHSTTPAEMNYKNMLNDIKQKVNTDILMVGYRRCGSNAIC